MDNVPATAQTLVSFARDGFVGTAKPTEISVGQASFVDVNMARAETTQTIPATTGGTVATPDGGSVAIPANSLVDATTGTPYTGTASVSVTTFDPTNTAELNAFPGRFEGVTRTGQTVLFVTFGFMDVTVRAANGNALQLGAGRTATLTIPVPSSIRQAAPATLPQWYFDTGAGVWREEGTFTLTGNAYVGTVPHLSIWNCDVGAARCVLRGRVVDETGLPVLCAKVTLLNLGPRGRFTSGEYCTGSDGRFEIPVDANSRVEYTAEKSGIKSTPAQTDTCPDGGSRDIGDIVLGGVAKARITLTWGENPRDLDSHLAVPKADATGYNHYYFGNRGSTVDRVQLDTDDTSGFGPEIFAIYLLRPGIYRYSVHHYSGTGKFSTSQAAVNLILDGVGIFSFSPPASGDLGTNDVWRVFDLVVDAQGRVSVRTIGDYLNNRSSGDASAFTP